MTPAADVREQLEPYRRELTGYCYRMLGSPAEAEDAVQEALVKAWRSADRFEGRSSVRTWLYRITTNVCLDHLRGRQRRARPMDLGGSVPPEERYLADRREGEVWMAPARDDRVLPDGLDPADLAAQRDSVRLAFVAALQHLPARQRAALILCEVLRWQAAEVAELLDTSTAAVNSALQRARATLDGLDVAPPRPPLDDAQRALLDRYVAAFERYDLDELVTLLRADAVQSMPPFAMWLEGAEDIVSWMRGPGAGCEGSVLRRAGTSGGSPVLGQYRVDPEGGWSPWAVTVVELDGHRVGELHFFLGPDLFPTFGLPLHLGPDGEPDA